MRLLSILARVGLVFLGAVIITAVSADIVWEDSSDEELTTSDLASALFGDWALPLLALGFLMAMAMVGAAYLVRDERLVNLEWELTGGEKK